MILAAGLGTRLQPYTLSKPKALVEIDGVSLLEIILRKLKQNGFNSVVINVHHFAEQIIDFIVQHGQFGMEIRISDERDLLMDTGGGILQARKYLEDGEPVLIHNVDVLSDIDLRALYQFHMKNKPLATLAVKNRKTSRSLLINDKNQLCGWRNEVSGDTIISREQIEHLQAIAFSAIHVISPEIFSLITEQGAFSIIKTYLRLAKDHEILVWQHDQNFWLDVGRAENVKEASRFLNTL